MAGPWKHLFQFSGRLSRRQFWQVLVVILAADVMINLPALIGRVDPESQAFWREGAGRILQALFTVGNIVVIVASAAAIVQRSHDAGHRGVAAILSWLLAWPILHPVWVMAAAMLALSGGLGEMRLLLASRIFGVLALTAAIGDSPLTLVLLRLGWVVGFTATIIFVWLLLRPSQPGSNRWGPDPREAPAG